MIEFYIVHKIIFLTSTRSKMMDCPSEELSKNRIVKGRQRYKCKHCGYNYSVTQKGQSTQAALKFRHLDLLSPATILLGSNPDYYEVELCQCRFFKRLNAYKADQSMPTRFIRNLGYNTVRAVPPPIRQPIIHMIRKLGNRCSETLGRWRGNAVPAYWYRDSINFGDLLTPALLRYYGFSPYFFDNAHQEGRKNDLVIVGSILTFLHPDFKGIVLGSGAMFEEPREFPHALFLAVRGELTKKLFRCADSVKLGDPGLLADRLFPMTTPKKYRLGVVVHQAEWDNKLFAGKFDSADTKLIDPRRYPLDVLSDIAECEYIASSSLHGLIIADSFAIPCVRILLSDRLILGGDFKFNDYYSSIGIQHEKIFISQKIASRSLIELTNIPAKEIIMHRKNDLHKLFTGLKTIMEEREQGNISHQER